MHLLKGKRALICGIANRRSLAYGIAVAMREAGAEIAMSYHKQPVARQAHLIATDLDAAFCEPCDVTNDAAIDTLFNKLALHWDKFDILVHAIAFADSAQLQGHYLAQSSREDFRIAHEISSYSFTALAKRAALMLRPKGALLTLTYLGSQRVVPYYNMMGLAKASLETSVRYLAYNLGPSDVRVNAISAGPIPTLAASGIQGFKHLLDQHQKKAPLSESTTLETIGKTAVCLCSDWMQGVTGEIIHVDGGMHATAFFE